MKRILSRPTALLGLLPVLMLCLAPLHAQAAGAAAADVANGYAGEAMEKILANWAAPADRGKVRIVVRVDAEGKVERCGYLEKSASQALNDSVCGAVMKTADLGKPPYGMSQDVYLTFWQGNMADLSGISRRKAAAKPAAGTAAPAAAAPAPEAKSEPVTLDTKPATLTTPLKAQDAYGPKHAAYFRKLVMELRNATFIPAEPRAPIMPRCAWRRTPRERSSITASCKAAAASCLTDTSGRAYAGQERSAPRPRLWADL